MSFCLCTTDYWADASVYADDSAAGTAPGNLIKPQPSDLWRAANATGGRAIDIDLGSARQVDFIALLYSNIAVGGSIDYRAATSQANLDSAYTHQEAKLFADFYDSATIARRHVINIMSAPHSARWWRVTIPEQAAAISIGNFVIGERWEARALYGAGITVDASSVSTARGAGGQRFGGRPGDELPMTMEASLKLSTTEFEEQARRIDALSVMRKPVVAIYDADSENYMQRNVVYGLITEQMALRMEGYNKARARLKVEGMI